MTKEQATIQDEPMSPLRRALLAVKLLQAKVDALEQGKTEPIAIIGMGCRFPSAADTPEKFWQLLETGETILQEVPAARWDVDAYYHPDPENLPPGKTYTRKASFLAEVDTFDAPFFGIAGREASKMDPQQRLLLEVGWEALERAGQANSALLSSKTGVFLGISTQDYYHFVSNPIEQNDMYTMTGNHVSVAAGRLAYTWGLTGPTFTLDTACSSSLVAVHLACQSLRAQECDMALAGGVALMLTPHLTIQMAQAGALSPDSLCKTFAAAANGYSQGEGCGLVVLKRLTDALRDEDNIVAVIRGSAINHDGRSSGLTVPNAAAQQAVIKQAIANSGLQPAHVGYLEAHGTGTLLGDPIEVEALGAVFQNRTSPLLIGSAKTNIGHLDSAAGVAGLIKVVLALQHKVIPPHLHCTELNPRIAWDTLPIQVATATQPFPLHDGKRCAGVSAFGVSGTNSHVIVEEAPPALPKTGSALERPWHLLNLSAKSPEALAALAQRYVAFLAAQPVAALGDICYTANLTRSHFAYRLSTVADSVAEMRAKLAAYRPADGENDQKQGYVADQRRRERIAFLFTGQGAQYVNMGRELYATEPRFRAALDQCDALLQPYLDQSLLAILYPQPSDSASDGPTLLDQTTYTQPALFALEYALAQLWQAWGVRPHLLIGHSVGEIAAACIAGVFSLEDAIKLVAARGKLMGALPQNGAMVSLAADEAHVQQAIDAYYAGAAPVEVTIAAVNGPESVVISGKAEAVFAIAEQLAAAGVKTRKLTVSHAFHSPLMAPMLAAFRQVAVSLTYHKPTVPLVSTVTGQLADAQISTPAYWVRHVHEAVRFADGLAALYAQGANILLEIGPGATLLGMAQTIVELGLGIADATRPAPATPFMAPSLRKGQSDWQQLLGSLGDLYVHGVALDWKGFDRAYQRHKVLLPTYPFQRQRYWMASTAAAQADAKTPKGLIQWFADDNLEQLTARIATKGAFSAAERQTIAKVLQTLEAESHTQQAAAQLAALLYAVAWERQDKPQLVMSPITPGNWLILADAGRVGLTLAEQLTALGAAVTLVATPAELTTYIDQLSSNPQSGPALQGVVHLWGINEQNIAADLSSDVGEALLTRQERTLGSMLQLAQTLARHTPHGGGKAGRLWVATQGAQQLSPTEQVAVHQTPLWGLGRVIALEHHEVWGGLIDLDPTAEPTVAAEALLTEILPLLSTTETTSPETQVAYRDHTRYVARLVRGQLPKGEPKELCIRADAAYLVTGGLGGLGLHVAAWLVAQGAKQIILMGRHGITTDQQQKAVNQLETQGATVQIAQVDVADTAAMQKFFAQLAQSSIPLKGIFHTAGVLDDGILLNQNWARFTNVLAAKVVGSWLLHTLTQPMTLDLFVFFSSLTALFGDLGQGNYAAANAFMDGLARYRQQQKLPALSINWGAWSEVGMAARTAQSNLSDKESLTPQVGIAALSQLLAHDPLGYSQIGVTPIDWAAFEAENSRQQPFFANFVSQTKQNKPATEAKPLLIEELAALPGNRRLEVLGQHLQQRLTLILGTTGVIEREMGFTEMGMDSLMALELRRQLQRDFQITLPTTIAFEYPTIHALAAYLLNDALALVETQTSDTQVAGATPQERQHASGMDEPIAVISMACRFPGANTPEAFWDLLCAGVDRVQEIPPVRWNIDDYYDPQRPTPGKMYMREAAFIDQVDQFDPLFFGIAPREATGMDPHHRLLLEISWEAFERAGLAQHTLIDSPTGVFVGIGESSYGGLSNIQDLAYMDTHAATSGGPSIAAGRLAYTLGLQGPTLAVDTACSSSLVALHLACQSLRAGECDLALAGGVSLLLSPKEQVALSQMQALASDGRCKAFDASADGYGRGEGAGMVLLKRISDAQGDGDTILALIKGSAINHDGPSSGLTVPNKRAQEKLIRQALANAQVKPHEVSYIEAHGTGTPLGDPIELRALGAVFGAADGTKRQQPLLVGTVKTNIGHLEAAAGIAGFMKTVLALHYGQIPPSLHFKTPNPYIEWDALAIAVATNLQPWPSFVGGQTATAGVSSFGLSGTNAHLIVAAATQANKITGDSGVSEGAASENQLAGKVRQWRLLPLSAKQPAALLELATRYGDYLRTHPTLALRDICHTAAVGRNQFNHRLALLATDHEDLQTKLAAVQRQAHIADVIQGITSQSPLSVAFLFTGQGSQYIGMGQTLYETAPSFRATLDRCDEILQAYLGRSLIELLYPTTPPDHNDLMASHPCGQAANFALECALADLWRAWGIEPTLVLGHSLGDFAAAYTAGVLSLEAGLRLVVERGRLMETAVGTMVSVLASAADVEPFVAAFADVTIGVINGPQSVVISGGQANVAVVAAQLQAAGFKTRTLEIPVAAHSPMLEPILADFEAAVRQVTLAPPRLQVVSSMTGQLVTTELTDPAYWRQQLRNTVRFADGVVTLQEQGVQIFLEIGPGATLLGMAQTILEAGLENVAPVSSNRQSKSQSPVMLPSLRKNQHDWQQMLTSLGELYVHGAKINWDALNKDGDTPRACHKVRLPTYPFQRERYWVQPPTRQPQTTRLTPLIDRITRSPRVKEIICETTFSIERLPFLADHRVFGEVVSPGACQLAMALDAAYLAYPGQPIQLADVVLPQALTLAADEVRTVQVIFSSVAQSSAQEPNITLDLISFPTVGTSDTPRTHASGRLNFAPIAQTPPMDIAALQVRCPTPVDLAVLDAQTAAQQIDFGPCFRWLAGVWRGEGEILGRLVLPEAIGALRGFRLHPALLDACLQVTGALHLEQDQEETRLPFAVDSLTLPAGTNGAVTGREWWCYARQDSEQRWQIQLLDSTGVVLVQIEGFTDRVASPHLVLGKEVWQEWLYQVQWQPQPAYLPPLTAARELDGLPAMTTAVVNPNLGTGRTWLLLADQRGLGAALAAQLAQQGERPILVYPGEAFQQGTEIQQSECAGESTIDTFAIRPYEAADYQRLLNSLSTVYGVVYLWGLDAPSLHEAGRADKLSAALRQSCAPSLHLIQTLLHQNDIPPRLWLVTQDAQAVLPADQVNNFAQAALWGLGRTVALEHPECHCQCIDLDGNVALPAQAATLGALLHRSALQTAVEDAGVPQAEQVALRGHTPYAARLVAHQPQQAAREPIAIRADATYLLTGGLGGLGLQVARWLVEQGAAHLLLLGRNRPTPVAQAAIDEMQALGAEITVLQADVSQREAVMRVLAYVPADRPLRGIIHAAGVLDDGAFLHQSWERFANVFNPKVMGAWHLHSLTQALPLDFCLFFSSVAGLLGSRGQANHAAANALLDSFAHYRQANHCATLSIGWGAWAEVGAATAVLAQFGQQMAARGEGAIEPQQGIAALAYLLPQREPHVAVLPMSWAKFMATEQAANPFFAEFSHHQGQRTRAKTTPALSFRQQLEQTDPKQQQQLLAQHIATVAAQILGFTSPQQEALPINANTEFMAVGMDSLMALELRRQLEASLGVHLRSTLIFEYPTLDRLVAYLIEQLRPAPEQIPDGAQQGQVAPSLAVERPAATPDAVLDELSAEALADLLAQELEAIA
ncbi:MAG: SDR family NAD(P)-dependent oxidoreductase [Caldilineaceae bacterium]